jgi:hypothetical protein
MGMGWGRAWMVRKEKWESWNAGEGKETYFFVDVDYDVVSGVGHDV